MGHLCILKSHIIVVLIEELSLLVLLLVGNIFKSKLRLIHLFWAVEQNFLRNSGQWICQISELIIAMGEAAQVAIFTRSIYIKILASLSFVIAMHCSNIILPWKALWQGIFDVSLLGVAVSERTCISESTRLELLIVLAYRCLIFNILNLALILRQTLLLLINRVSVLSSDSRALRTYTISIVCI